ncbi:MAG TPA: multicopper oxidase domain-containing protein [Flavobacteriales bacterium]|nr:multicopper oxidase domain-containing protein [Flavobacteriales bacterium]HNU55025.1 multicopper oxidase domain-containing protein [Flavobacteriales bacterium]
MTRAFSLLIAFVLAIAARGQGAQGLRPLGTSVPNGDFTPKVTRYELFVSDTIVNYTGKDRKACAVNGGIPMPTLEFTEGDTALIIVHNVMGKEETSLHWHGLILPNEFDGVPYLTTAPIRAGETQVYKFPLVQHGTYWYHSHTGMQEQNGMYGALIIHERGAAPLPEHVVVLSEWTDMKPNEVHRRLHAANDWSALKKHGIRPGSVQSYSDAIKAGALGTKLKNEWKRMNAMDVSDVYYDAFLANGVREDEAPQLKAGDRVRVRLVNGSASTYFWISYAGGKMDVVASDGADVEPVPVDRFIMGIAETYDVIVTIPADSTAYELLATAEDRTRSTSVWLGNGIKQLAMPMMPLKYFEGMKMMNGMMKMNGDLDDMGMNMSLQQMDMNVVMYPEITGPAKEVKQMSMEHSEHMDHGNMYNSNALSDIVTLNYAMLRSPTPTALPPGPVTELRFELTGNMDRYVWAINNRTISETDKILIRKGENVRVILYNNSMMRHPMHLHGHFFRVVNGQGDHAPLKNVLDIMPMETDTIEFLGTEEGDWFFHCHILYHMMSGMGRVFSYADAPAEPKLPLPKHAWRTFLNEDRQWHFMGMSDFANNGIDGEAMLMNKRWALEGEWRLGYTEMHGQEVETHFGRYLGKMQWWFINGGIDWRTRMHGEGPEENLFSQGNTKDRRSAAHVGFRWTLPMLVKLDVRIDTDGRLRAQLMREDMPLTPHLRLDAMYNSDFESMAALRYVFDKTWALRTHYDSDMGFGVGVTVTY